MAMARVLIFALSQSVKQIQLTDLSLFLVFTSTAGVLQLYLISVVYIVFDYHLTCFNMT